MGIRSWLTADKAMHFMACALVAALAGSLLPWWAGAVVVLGIGIAKKLIWDMWMKRGTASWGDLAADVLGIPVGIMIALLLSVTGCDPCQRAGADAQLVRAGGLVCGGG